MEDPAEPQSRGSHYTYLNGVAATSTTNAWAVIEHWNGKTWTVQPTPNPGGMASLSQVAASSATTAWAVGDYVHNGPKRQTAKTLILHCG